MKFRNSQTFKNKGVLAIRICKGQQLRWLKNENGGYSFCIVEK